MAFMLRKHWKYIFFIAESMKQSSQISPLKIYSSSTELFSRVDIIMSSTYLRQHFRGEKKKKTEFQMNISG